VVTVSTSSPSAVSTLISTPSTGTVSPASSRWVRTPRIRSDEPSSSCAAAGEAKRTQDAMAAARAARMSLSVELLIRGVAGV
jgi:hypothetical protein